MKKTTQHTVFCFAVLICLCHANYDQIRDSLKGWCPMVPNIPNANVQRFEIHPNVVKVVCKQGYILVGSEKLVCRNATWVSNELPRCEGKDKPPVSNAGGNVSLVLPLNYVTLNGSNSYDDHGIISYHWWIDDPSFTVDMKGTKTPYLQLYNLLSGTYRFKLKVVDSLGQQAVDTAVVTVRKVTNNQHCWSVPDIKHGRIEWIHAGQSGLIRCDRNRFIHINGMAYRSLGIYCTNGKWRTTDGQSENVSLVCEQDIVDPSSDCGDPPQISHGQAIRIQYNQVKYKCDDGYYNPTGSVVLTCQGSQWIGNRPITQDMCGINLRFTDPSNPFVIKTCPTPPSIKDGEWHAKIPGDIDFLSVYGIGTKVTYRCISDDYQLLGNPVIECQQDMTWSRQHPICLNKSELSDKDFYCPSIPPIPNGQCQCDAQKNTSYCEPFYLTMKIQCSCNNGYRLTGNQFLTCSGKGAWNYYQPTCIKDDNGIVDTEDHSVPSPTSANRMNTLAVVIATACSVLGILLLIMVVMIVRRRKPRPRHYHQMGIPPPYQRVHSSSFDDLDRVALIGYDAARLPTYEEAVRNNTTAANQQGLSEVQISSDYRPLPSIPSAVRNTNAQNNDIQSINSNRHSITTMSTVNRDGVSEVFGSIDTVNYSMSDASTSVTVDTLDSSISHPSHGSGTATAGSVTSSNENITEDVPLLESNRVDSVSQGETMDVKDDDKDY